MKAKQLIERLKDFPEDMEVYIEGWHSPLNIGEVILVSQYDHNIILLRLDPPTDN